MKPKIIRLFIKSHCPWCHEAMAWLERRGLPYQSYDVTQDLAARKEMHDLSQQTLAPVIEVDGNILADFDTQQLEVFWKQHGYE